MSYSSPTLPIAVFSTDVVEMLDYAWHLSDAPYFSIIARVGKCSWRENRACLLWLLIRHPQFHIK